jgi:hypothetical protein
MAQANRRGGRDDLSSCSGGKILSLSGMADPTKAGQPNRPAEAGSRGGSGVRHWSWPLAVMVVAGCGVVAVALQQCSPGAQAEKFATAGNTMVKGMEKLAEAINEHKVTETFVDAEEAQHPDLTNPLLVATDRRTEQFDDEDSSLLGGTATAEIRVPVTYHYYVALTDPWQVNVQVTPAGVVGEVLAPALHPLDPALDTTGLEMKSSNGWANWSGQKLQDDLLKDLTVKLKVKAQENLANVYASSHEGVEKFVRDWILKQYDLPPGTPIYLHVTFRNEPGAPPALVPASMPKG